MTDPTPPAPKKLEYLGVAERTVAGMAKQRDALQVQVDALTTKLAEVEVQIEVWKQRTFDANLKLDAVEAALAKTEKFLGEALTCAQYGLDEVDWADVHDWLRRDEAQSRYYRATHD